MKNLLTWAESWQKNEIPEQEISNLSEPMQDSGFDPIQANHEL